MKVQILYTIDCPWCMKTKKLVRESLAEIGVKAEVEEILIDTDKKARRYHFQGSPTVRINGKDVQEAVCKGRCLPCEELAERVKSTTEFVKTQCHLGCRVYFYRGKQYPYPPKGMIKAVLKKSI
ncbi:MAG: DUF2703 domain-containing protein [Candidatus Hadarchaeum sp.]|uniref:DUF2703 domain-containing protein n=1 Tax=Candidatus Hadarchaeum sp. TaxID=2883567 RepID=UPI003D0DD3C9